MYIYVKNKSKLNFDAHYPDYPTYLKRVQSTDQKPTEKDVLEGLDYDHYLIQKLQINRKDYKLTRPIIEKALNHKNDVVRLTIAQRKKQKPTEDDVIKGLQDTNKTIRSAQIRRNDYKITDNIFDTFIKVAKRFPNETSFIENFYKKENQIPSEDQIIKIFKVGLYPSKLILLNKNLNITEDLVNLYFDLCSSSDIDIDVLLERKFNFTEEYLSKLIDQLTDKLSNNYFEPITKLKKLLTHNKIAIGNNIIDKIIKSKNGEILSFIILNPNASLDEKTLLNIIKNSYHLKNVEYSINAILSNDSKYHLTEEMADEIIKLSKKDDEYIFGLVHSLKWTPTIDQIKEIFTNKQKNNSVKEMFYNTHQLNIPLTDDILDLLITNDNKKIREYISKNEDFKPKERHVLQALEDPVESIVTIQLKRDDYVATKPIMEKILTLKPTENSFYIHSFHKFFNKKEIYFDEHIADSLLNIYKNYENIIKKIISHKNFVFTTNSISNLLSKICT